MLQNTCTSTTRRERILNPLLLSLPGVLRHQDDEWGMPEPSFQVEKVRSYFDSTWNFDANHTTGAASDKVAALERAGAIVTDSPAKIGVEMLKVGLSQTFVNQESYESFRL